MKKIKESKLEEYTWKAAFVPFSWMAKKYNRGGGKTTRKEALYVAINALIYAALLAGGTIYLFTSMIIGTPNYKKWPDIQKQKEIEQNILFKQSVEESFQRYDKNGNGTIDFQEFYQYEKEHRY